MTELHNRDAVPGDSSQAADLDERRSGGDRRGIDLRRLKVVLTGTLFVEGGPSHLVITNISESGLAGRAACRMTQDARVEVAFGSAPRMTGDIVWVKDNRFGLRFEKPVALDACLPRGVETDRLYEELERRASRIALLDLQRSGRMAPETPNKRAIP